jgi:hypothetical protein
MTEEIKKQLMQYLHKVAAHYTIENAALISFKKRNELLEKLKIESESAWKLVNAVFETHIQLDRIQNDKEKQSKKPELWNSENEITQQAKEKAEENLEAFLKKENIQ